MARKMISEIIKGANRLESKEERIDFLKKHNHPALLDIFRIAYDDDVVSLLPKGAPEYKKDDAPDGYNHTTLYREFKKFKFFFKGPIGSQMNPIKREKLFLDILETLHPDESEILVQAKDKKFKFKYVTKKLVSDTFPNLLKKVAKEPVKKQPNKWTYLY